ncbi:hypothetical protein ACJX0J_023530, partial [Zea mays]
MVRHLGPDFEKGGIAKNIGISLSHVVQSNRDSSFRDMPLKPHVFQNKTEIAMASRLINTLQHIPNFWLHLTVNATNGKPA